ncbi:MAG: tetratricopeptide repeat protein, partial [Chthoniobacteraceae bacterium]
MFGKDAEPPFEMIDEREVFAAAAALPVEERAVYLDAACAGRAEMRASIERLLAAHDEDSFMQRGATRTVSPELAAEFARLKPEEAGDQIANYKLLQQIGEGGFGVVWMAEQEKPVRRRVALKIIKLGMDTKEVIGRFEQERQALAMMDHPNIAKVFDAGATQFGRPFFVMELVRGIKITEYCDQNNLPTEGRLQLFIEVCNAVQHAHQKGVIHRDLKPSNILVTLHDGTPVPKVIDFGVAKATQQQRLTDLTVFTQFEQMIGTPLYMSPEQAEMSGLDIDTRSDIYSLGVLLYELLTGRTPFDPEELMRKGLDEMRLAIREQEPPKPSTVLHTMAAEKRTAIAHRRQADSAKLVGQIQGDLDWIVMKALEKDRTRRYETANGLARDVERHLASEPITARPTSQLYRFQRLVRRNKLVFAAGAMVVAALLVGTIVSTWQASRARRAERVAQGERDRANEARLQTEAINRFFTVDLLGEARPDQNARERKVTMEEVLERAALKLDRDPDIARHPETEATLRLYVGNTCFQLGALEPAERHLRRAVALRREKLGPRNPDTLAAQESLAWFLSGGVRRYAEAETLSRETWETRREVLGPENPDTLNSLDTYAGILQNQRKMAEAEKMLRECVRLREHVLGARHRDTLISLGNLACLFAEEGHWAESEQLGRKILARRQQNGAGNDMESFAASSNLALARFAQGDSREAEQILVEARERAEGICGREHPYTMHLQHVLARVLASQGEARRDKA